MVIDRNRNFFRYSLISIRQNYNFDMLAMIWHKIVCWFLKIYQDLKHRNKELFLFWFLDVQNNFMFPTIREQSKVGKFSEINKQFHVKSWLTYRSYSSVWWILGFPNFWIFFPLNTLIYATKFFYTVLG